MTARGYNWQRWLFRTIIKLALIRNLRDIYAQRPRKLCLVKFTFRADPHQNAFWGTLGFEVNFTGWGDPCQKCLWSRFDVPVKFTFRAYPLQKGFWGRLPCEVERLCIHLEALPPSQVLQRHIVFRGEFHRSRLPLPEVLQRPIRRSRDIHLRD